MATSTLKLQDITDEIVALPNSHGNMRFIKSGNIVNFYAVIVNLGNDTSINLGTVPQKYRPKATYALSTLYKNEGVYPPDGSIWISNGGAVSAYKSASTTSAYIFGTYVAQN